MSAFEREVQFHGVNLGRIGDRECERISRNSVVLKIEPREPDAHPPGRGSPDMPVQHHVAGIRSG